MTVAELMKIVSKPDAVILVSINIVGDQWSIAQVTADSFQDILKNHSAGADISTQVYVRNGVVWCDVRPH